MEFDFVMDAVLVDQTTYTKEFINEVFKFSVSEIVMVEKLVNGPS